MDIKTAIEKAIEEGYKNPIIDNCLTDAESGDVLENQDNDLVANLFLDPLFWKSLGKAGVFKLPEELREVDIHPLDRESKEALVKAEKELWIYEWHRFIDHLAENKDAESFFESL